MQKKKLWKINFLKKKKKKLIWEEQPLLKNSSRSMLQQQKEYEKHLFLCDKQLLQYFLVPWIQYFLRHLIKSVPSMCQQKFIQKI